MQLRSCTVLTLQIHGSTGGELGAADLGRG